MVFREDDPNQINLKGLKELYDQQKELIFTFENECPKLKQKIKRLSNSIGFQITLSSENEWVLKRGEWKSEKLDKK